MVHHWLLLLIAALFLAESHAQDERFYRQLLSGELLRSLEPLKEVPVTQFNVLGPAYKIDLDGDAIEETLQPQKRDGVDWLEVRNSSERKIYETKLFAMGAQSALYKIKLVHITPKVKTLILFLDEGFTEGRRFESTARIFLLTYENNDLSTLKLTQGPHFFHEKQAQRDQYFRRDYMVNVYDIDNDGIREIAVQFNHIQRIFRYEGKGSWRRY